MSTIQENLQTIADSTAAIKQAIIDKGGEITGDITTWASAINGISGGGGETVQSKVFNGNAEINKLYYDIYGDLDSPFDEDGYVVVVGKYGTRILSTMTSQLAGGIDTYIELSLSPNEPLGGGFPFVLFFTDLSFSKVIPITVNLVE